MKSQLYLFNIAWVDQSSEAHLSAVHYLPFENVLRVSGSSGILVEMQYSDGKWYDDAGNQTWLTKALGNRIVKKLLKAVVSDRFKQTERQVQIA